MSYLVAVLSILAIGCNSESDDDVMMGGGSAADNGQALTPACVGVEKQAMAGGAEATGGAQATGGAVEGGVPASNMSAGEATGTGGDSANMSSNGGAAANVGGVPAPGDSTGGGEMAAQAPGAGANAATGQGAGCERGAMCVSGACVSEEFDGAISRVVLGSGTVTDAGNTLVKLDVPQGLNHSF